MADIRQRFFTDVRPGDRHIGPPGSPPQGFGISYYAGESAVVEIAGIQIRGFIPEPSGATMAGWLCAAAAVRRRRRATLLS